MPASGEVPDEQRTTGSGNGIVVPKASSVQSLAELKGKTISVPFASTAHGMLLRAVKDQVDRLMVMPQSLPNDKRAEFLTELVGVTPAGLDRVFLCNSGTEAMEAAK